MSPPARVSVSTLTPGEKSVATVVLGRSSSGSDGAADGGGARGGGDDSTAEADASDGPAVNVISAIRRRATTSLACAAPRCMSHAFCSSIVRAFSSAMRVPGCRLAGASMMCARGWCRLWFSCEVCEGGPPLAPHTIARSTNTPSPWTTQSSKFCRNLTCRSRATPWSAQSHNLIIRCRVKDTVGEAAGKHTR